MKKVFENIFFLFLLLMVNILFSQEREYIIGKLLDAKTEEPIAFASIRIKDRALGIISNTDGSFKIPMRYKELGDIIEISSMGYQSREIQIDDFSSYEINNIRLQPALLKLQEVVVSAKGRQKKPLSAKNIVRKAIKAIPINYPDNSFSTVGYYRDYQLQDGNYLNLNEAVFEVFDLGFSQSDYRSTKVRIYDYKENNDFKRDSVAMQPYDFKNRRKTIDKAFLPNYGGNEFMILRVHDAIRNYKTKSYVFVYRLKQDFVMRHSFFLESDAFLDSERMYAISIIKYHDNYRVQGKLYISRNDYAIHKLEYALYYNNPNTDKKLNDKGRKDKLIFKVSSEYKKVNGKMYLNYISFQNSFNILGPPLFKIDKIKADLRLGKFEVTFNNPVNEKTAEILKNYQVLFREEKIKLKKMIVDKKGVSLYPDNKKAASIFNELKVLSANDKLSTELLEFKIESLKDDEGNFLNEPTVLEFLQFREFFAQEIKTNTSLPNDNLFMNKSIPIFKNQPVARPDNFDDYWMNTPLQKTEQ